MSDPEIARIAGDLYHQRQAAARHKLRAGEWNRDQAEAKLRPWAAIACLAGADLPELEDALAELRVIQIFNAGDGTPTRYDVTRSDGEARALLATDICGARQWQAALTAARDAAILRHDAAPGDHTEENARNLQQLCEVLGVTIPFAVPIVQPERNAA